MQRISDFPQKYIKFFQLCEYFSIKFKKSIDFLPPMVYYKDVTKVILLISLRW